MMQNVSNSYTTESSSFLANVIETKSDKKAHISELFLL